MAAADLVAGVPAGTGSAASSSEGHGAPAGSAGRRGAVATADPGAVAAGRGHTDAAAVAAGAESGLAVEARDEAAAGNEKAAVRGGRSLSPVQTLVWYLQMYTRMMMWWMRS